MYYDEEPNGVPWAEMIHLSKVSTDKPMVGEQWINPEGDCEGKKLEGFKDLDNCWIPERKRNGLKPKASKGPHHEHLFSCPCLTNHLPAGGDLLPSVKGSFFGWWWPLSNAEGSLHDVDTDSFLRNRTLLFALWACKEGGGGHNGAMKERLIK